MKNILKNIVTAITLLLLHSSCTNVEKGFPTTIQTIKTTELTVNKQVLDVVNAATGLPVVYAADDVIEAYVTSNDAGGNFYKSISFQTIPTSGSPVGFSISVDQTMLFTKGFTPGRKVYIKLKGLSTAIVFGSLAIGVADPTSTTGLTGLSEVDYQNYLFPSATLVSEETFVRHLTLAQATATSTPQTSVLNTLIEIDNSQFADNSIARTLFDVDNGGFGTNHELVDATLGDNTPGIKKYCRISKYSPLSSNNVPSGRGSVRGILTKYNSDFQLIVRQIEDFKLTAPRTYVFNATLNEPFTSYATSQVAFTNYLNFSPLGTKKWLIKTGFLEMSAFGGATEENKSYFIVPVDMTAANTFKFDLKVGFYTGALGLKVYRSADYVPGNKISSATLYEITSSFNNTFPVATTSTFSTYTYTIPTIVTGNGYFIFEYTGTNKASGPPVTTTIDIDNIIIN